jgi:hypothetical protein
MAAEDDVKHMVGLPVLVQTLSKPVIGRSERIIDGVRQQE